MVDNIAPHVEVLQKLRYKVEVESSQVIAIDEDSRLGMGTDKLQPELENKLSSIIIQEATDVPKDIDGDEFVNMLAVEIDRMEMGVNLLDAQDGIALYRIYIDILLDSSSVMGDQIDMVTDSVHTAHDEAFKTVRSVGFISANCVKRRKKITGRFK